jgi:LysW-gamma-L-lysine carboxypeptidase
MQPLGEPVPAYRGQKNNALVRAFVSSIRQGEGEPGFLLKSGTSDLNLVAPAWGCPAVAYGPGDSSLDHTPHEHISLVEYERAVSVLERLIRTLAETTAT